MGERYCPAYGPGSKVCPPSICDCFIQDFPDDMVQAGALHPEFFQVGKAPLQDGTCPAKMTVANMAGLPLDCTLPDRHDGPHRDSTTNARWIP